MSAPDELVLMNVTLASGVRVAVWVDPDTAARIWNMAEHECAIPPDLTDSETTRYVCPACGAHWVKTKRMIGRKMYRAWHRMSDEHVQRMREQRRDTRPV